MTSSLSKEKAEEICKFIKENSSALFGQKFWECRFASPIQIQQKADKWGGAFIAIAKFRVFLLNGKNTASLKTERSFNIVALRHIELHQHDQVLQIGWEERHSGGKQSSPPLVAHLFARTLAEQGGGTSARDLAFELLSTLKHYFPDVQKSLGKLFSCIGPPSLLSDFSSLPSSTPELPCHNFRRSYVAYCDSMEQPFRDEVIWDIERIYFTHGQHELDLNDFSHLSIKDQQALLGAIQFSDFFTGIFAETLRLQPDHFDALLCLVRRSHSLKSIQLNRCTLPKDFLANLAAALSLNLNLPLERLRLSGISLDDRKALALLSSLIPQLTGLHSLSLPDCALNEKLALVLLHGLHHGIGLANNSMEDGGTESNAKAGFQLRALNLSGNPMGGGSELAEQLANLMALSSGAIRHLDLTGTAVQLDRLWAALKLGGLNLEVLRLGNCYLAPQKRHSGGTAKNSAQVAHELFLGIRQLKELNLSGTQLGAELLQGILSGLSANSHLPPSSLQIFLDNCIGGSTVCISVLEQHLPNCASIQSLSLRDNALEHEAFRLLSAISQMSGLRSLDIGGANFSGLKSSKKHASMLAGILAELVKLLNGLGEGDGPSIEELSLADSKLGSHLSVLLNALGLCGTLKRLDLANCELGSGGARLLGKSLQINHSLHWLSLDRNQIGPDGFMELARALRLNNSLLGLQTPSVDLADSMLALARSPLDKSRLLLVVEEIEQALDRNRRILLEGGPTQSQLAQRTIFMLNNACDRYEVNGGGSEMKKIVFHKLSKMVVQMGQKEENNDEEGARKEEKQGNGGGQSSSNRSELVEQLAERVEQRANRESEQFLRKFVHSLSEEEGIEMLLMEGEQQQKQQKTMTNGGGHDVLAAVQNDESSRDEKLHQDLDKLICSYSRKFAWARLLAHLDRLLSAPADRAGFRVIERQQTPSKMPKRGILIRSSGSAGTPSAANSKHRPVSAMMATMTDQQQQQMMSRSVMGDFAFAEENGNAAEALTTKTSCSEQEKMGAGTTSNRLLVHLGKHRPKPARLNRSRMMAIPIDEERVPAEDEDAETSSATTATAALDPLLARSSGSSSLSASLEQSLEQSPLMQQQRRKHRQQQQDGDPAPPPPPASSPPPIPAKGTPRGGSLTPPKLPPKPPSSPAAASGGTSSVASEDLRNKKTRVLPPPSALDVDEQE